MSTRTTRRWVIAGYPRGTPEAQHFRLEEAVVPRPAANQVLVRVQYLSMDPLPRLRLDPDSRMGPPLPIGSVMIGRGAGVVLESAHPQFRAGDAVCGELGWQELAVLEPTGLSRAPDGAPPTAGLHLLGSSGLAAYFALTETAAARSGDSVVVSAAAGSVGLAVGQIAAILGCRAVGVVRGPEQREFLDGRFGYAAAIDGEGAGLADRVRAACPHGVDVFLDSVGGIVHDEVMACINSHARIVLYGFISAYNASPGEAPEYGRIYEVIRKRARVSGFLVRDFVQRFPEAINQLAAWMREGRLTMPEVVTDGFENVPAAFAAIFGAARPGKHLVRVASAAEA